MIITFLNKPNISGNAVDKKRDVRIREIEPHIEGFIKKNTRFTAEEVTATFAYTGITSLVVFIEANEKYVLKIALSGHSLGESEFLKIWQKVGITVPKIYEEGEILTYKYILMEFIDAPILQDTYTEEELEALGKYRDAGRVLRSMHEPVAVGFGQYRNGRGEYDSFQEYFESEDYQKKIDIINEYKLLDDSHGSIEKMKEVILAFIVKNPDSSYCHFDYGLGHVFATEPLTVFDPAPHVNNRYIDIARTIVNYLVYGKYPEQLVEGYFENETKDERMLHASVMFNIVFKLPYIYKKGKTEVVNNLLEYLKENKSLLEI